MINSSKEADSPRKQEGDTEDVNKVVKASASSSSAPWLRLRDPRIVRVSRAYGGKDRHSKVYTMRGLRDRRVRLSVSTAIQLYDLQDRLGLNQPSKAVDWLLNAAKDEIDELPPLPMPPGNIGLNHAILSSYHGVGAAASDSNKEGLKMNNSINNWQDQGGLPGPNMWNSDALLRAKSKEVAADSINDKGNWMKRNEDDKEGGNSGGHGAHVSSTSFLSRGSHSSPTGMANNTTAAPYGSFFQLEPPNFPMSQLASHGLASQSEDLHNVNIVPLPSNLSLSSGSQILLCQPGTTTQSYFPSHVTASAEIDPRQISHFQMLNSISSTQNLLPNSLSPSPFSISQSMRPLHFSVTSRPLNAQTIENEAKTKIFQANDTKQR